MPRFARVYTIVIVLILAGAMASAEPVPTAITIEPGLTKGPVDAPVTIVEFSDYQ
jgi:hypothetical protein